MYTKFIILQLIIWTVSSQNQNKTEDSGDVDVCISKCMEQNKETTTIQPEFSTISPQDDLPSTQSQQDDDPMTTNPTSESDSSESTTPNSLNNQTESPQTQQPTTIQNQETSTIQNQETSTETLKPEETTTILPSTTTLKPNSSNRPSPRKGKQLEPPQDQNLLSEQNPSIPDTNALIQLIKDLTKKIENLEETQKGLNSQIDSLQKKLENLPEFQEKKEETKDELIGGDPERAIENWKDLSNTVESTEELDNVTQSICNDALEEGAPPSNVFDFIGKIPNEYSNIQESVYDNVCNKINESSKIQEQMYWKDMSKYCKEAENNLGPYNPSTIKMYNTQNQMRLNGYKPIEESCRYIQNENYNPAVSNWLTMVRDIPDSQPQLENNMKNLMLKTYNRNPNYLPFAFNFILILPINQGYYKQIAYKCLTQEMKSNGHYYNPNQQQSQQQGYN